MNGTGDIYKQYWVYHRDEETWGGRVFENCLRNAVELNGINAFFVVSGWLWKAGAIVLFLGRSIYWSTWRSDCSAFISRAYVKIKTV